MTIPTADRRDTGTAVTEIPAIAVDVNIAHLDETGEPDGWLGGPNSCGDAILSPAERERRSRLRFARDRKLFTLAHLLLRTSLSRHARDAGGDGSVAPANWSFVRGPHGKPLLAPEQMATHGLHFSLSHAGALAVCAVTHAGPVGVDVEPLASDIDTDMLAAVALNAEEEAALARLDASARRCRFLTLWTLKEACAKARGTGLLQPMQQIGFALGPPRLTRSDKDWAFDTREHAGAIVSTAVLSGATAAVRFRYRCSRPDERALPDGPRNQTP